MSHSSRLHKETGFMHLVRADYVKLLKEVTANDWTCQLSGEPEGAPLAQSWPLLSWKQPAWDALLSRQLSVHS